ncbi:SDR family oxidoreductase [Algoriphagus sp. D3-2-R+10]|uniref:SDR family oxidoreductase n=1 Tax=Algoriphagus aurantiacus TaxID=3103948 RepID=UPI002B3AA003|nr:SDR family oxidoreductase [Algoriphagus sp. D3-2-R+10]MEB2775077.1 SDR family oxidoreductase [Algoriphagus sp. D3-2-R+10]
MSKIMITGATGHFGKSTINYLIEKGVQASAIKALVRDESKAKELAEQGVTIKVGDYDNYDSLVAAFQGADKLLLISGTDLQNRSVQHKNVINAAKEAGVNHVLYTSFERKNEGADSPMALLAQSHIETDQALKASGLNYTIFRNNLYLSVIPMFVGEQVLDTGIFFPAGEGKVAFADRDNLAEAAANVLIGTGHENKEYAMNNVENYTFQTIATELSSVTGRGITYISPSGDVYSDALTKAGVPAEYIGLFISFAEAIKQGEFEAEKSDLETLLGKKPTSLKKYLAETYASGR